MTIKELCEAYDLRQVDLVNRFGIPLRTVQDWHAGRREPPDYVIQMVEELLKRDAEEHPGK